MSFVTLMNGTWGRAARVALGVALIAVGAVVGGTAGVVLAVVGLVPTVAGLAGVCLVAPLMHVAPRAR
jgi:hypothetical protein